MDRIKVQLSTIADLLGASSLDGGEDAAMNDLDDEELDILAQSEVANLETLGYTDMQYEEVRAALKAKFVDNEDGTNDIDVVAVDWSLQENLDRLDAPPVLDLRPMCAHGCECEDCVFVRRFL